MTRKLVAFYAFVVFVTIKADEPSSSPKPVVPIVSLVNTVDAAGNYNYAFESGDGSLQQQEGHPKVLDANHTEEVAQGSFSYKSDDGTVHGLTYVADEHGYQPQGADLPVGPTIPPLIARALQHLATLPPAQEKGKTS